MEVTKRAREHLKASLSQVKSTPQSESCFRIVQEGDGLRIEVDVPTSTDKTFFSGDEIILAIEPEVAKRCETMTLDVDTSKSSAELVFVPTPPGN
jgi:hypothetical protein